MMSVLHLLWIIPITFVIGVCCGFAETSGKFREYDEYGEDLFDGY